MTTDPKALASMEQEQRTLVEAGKLLVRIQISSIQDDRVRMLAKALTTARQEGRQEGEAAFRAALDERDLFLNPDLLDQAAGEIDCCPDCERVWREYDTNASGCGASERGDYCPNDVAETLRALAKLSRALTPQGHRRSRHGRGPGAGGAALMAEHSTVETAA